MTLIDELHVMGFVCGIALGVCLCAALTEFTRNRVFVRPSDRSS